MSEEQEFKLLRIATGDLNPDEIDCERTAEKLIKKERRYLMPELEKAADMVRDMEQEFKEIFSEEI